MSDKIYVTKILVTEEHYCFTEGIEIDFKKGINLIVGDQGCGKSTLLQGLSKNSIWLKISLTDDVITNGVSTFMLDTEKQNPRLSSLDNYSNPNGTSRGIGVGGAIASRFMSHGECIRDMVIQPLKKAKDCVIFFDEPESGLSVRSQYKLIKELNLAAKRGCQIFIATHCIPLIESENWVYSLEDKAWMTSSDFILNQKKNK